MTIGVTRGVAEGLGVGLADRAPEVTLGAAGLASPTAGTLGDGSGRVLPREPPSANATMPTIATATMNSGTGLRLRPPTLCSSTSFTGTVSVPTSET